MLRQALQLQRQMGVGLALRSCVSAVDTSHFCEPCVSCCYAAHERATVSGGAHAEYRSVITLSASLLGIELNLIQSFL